MFEEKRRYPRYNTSHEIDIIAPTGVRKTYFTLNHSESGMFVIAMADEQCPVGTELVITPTDDIQHKKARADQRTRDAGYQDRHGNRICRWKLT